MMTFKVLLIDDEPAALEGMQLWINWERIGFTLCGTASNGVEGLQMIEELQPDLVVTDVNMPMMNGLEMIAAWQEEHDYSVRFVILSGYSEFEYAQKALRYGVNNYLLKPIIPEEAEEELAEVYEGLVQEMEKRSFTQIASYEEIVSRIKAILHGVPLTQAAASVLDQVSELREKWNFCLIQTEAASFAELRAKVAVLLYPEEAMYLVDLDTSCFGIVYGYAPSQGLELTSYRTLQELVRQFSGTRVFMAVGAEAGTLLQIGDSYRTAKETAVYKFYDSGYDRIFCYEQISKRPFSYHYDQ